MPNDTKHWAIEIDKGSFNKLKSDERFWQLVALSRAVNALRFVQVAITARNTHEVQFIFLYLCTVIRSAPTGGAYVQVFPSDF
jgi:hypothetical protein